MQAPHPETDRDDRLEQLDDQLQVLRILWKDHEQALQALFFEQDHDKPQQKKREDDLLARLGELGEQVARLQQQKYECSISGALDELQQQIATHLHRLGGEMEAQAARGDALEQMLQTAEQRLQTAEQRLQTVNHVLEVVVRVLQGAGINLAAYELPIPLLAL